MKNCLAIVGLPLFTCVERYIIRWLGNIQWWFATDIRGKRLFISFHTGFGFGATKYYRSIIDDQDGPRIREYISLRICWNKRDIIQWVLSYPEERRERIDWG